MSAVIASNVSNEKQVRRQKSPSIMGYIKSKLGMRSFTKHWDKRNIKHGDVLVSSLELNALIFQQTIFIRWSQEIIEKLERIGFIILTTYPDSELYSKFIPLVMYHKKHNLALSLCNPQHEHAILTAAKIVEKSQVDALLAHDIFFAAIEVLMDTAGELDAK